MHEDHAVFPGIRASEAHHQPPRAVAQGGQGMRAVEDDGSQERQDLGAEAGIEKCFGFTRLYPAQDRSNIDARARDRQTVLHNT